MSIQQYSKKFPILLELPSPRGKVELIETIGKGNYGYVYKGKFSEINQMTAVKVVYLKEDEIRETLLEMQILQNCSHPNVTRFMGCFLKGLDLWICMELCSGGALDSIYRNIKKPFSEDHIAAILYEAVVGLQYIHDVAALIHRDIKAGNMFLTEEGDLKLGDFGVSANLGSPGARANTFIGTPYWMAPEVISTDPDNPNSKGASYDSKADIWSMGITAIELAEKNPPLSEMHPMRALTLIPTTELNFAKPKNFSKIFQDFVLFCLIKDPTQRPSAAQLLTHPFLSKAALLPRQKLIAELVKKAKINRERKRMGLDIEDEEEIVPPVAVPKVLHETLRMAKQALNPQIVQVSAATLVDQDPTFPAFQDEIPFADASTLLSKPYGPVFKSEVLTCDILDKRFVLLGLNTGLYYMDILNAEQIEPLLIIGNTRFKQIAIVDDYDVMMALSGKNDHIRQYKLSSIRNLIQAMTGESVLQLEQKDQVKEAYIALHPQTMDEKAVLQKWQNDYVKILNTKDSKSFVVQKTETSIFMGVLFKQDVILFEWAREPYLKFMKLKAFWLPEAPKFINMLHDGLGVTHVYLGYSNEANLVSVEDSKVRDVDVHREFLIEAQDSSKARWQTFEQIPFSEAKKQELRSTSTRTGNRKMAAIGGGHTLARYGKPVPDRFFLATFHRLTRVVDLYGQPMAGTGVGGWKDGVLWMEPPQKLILRPNSHVVAIGKQTVEVADWKTAVIIQKLVISSSVSIKILTIWNDGFLALADRKRKGFKLFAFNEKLNPQKIEYRSAEPKIEEPKKSERKNSVQISPTKVIQIPLFHQKIAVSTSSSGYSPASPTVAAINMPVLGQGFETMASHSVSPLMSPNQSSVAMQKSQKSIQSSSKSTININKD